MQVEYEETGWYDGQVFVKPPEVLARDRLLGSYEVRAAAADRHAVAAAAGRLPCFSMGSAWSLLELLTMLRPLDSFPGGKHCIAIVVLTRRPEGCKDLRWRGPDTACCAPLPSGQARAGAAQDNAGGQRRGTAAQHGPAVQPHP